MTEADGEHPLECTLPKNSPGRQSTDCAKQLSSLKRDRACHAPSLLNNGAGTSSGWTDQPIQSFGLISGHLRRLWSQQDGARCPSLPVPELHTSLWEGRKCFCAQLTYHRDDEMCCEEPIYHPRRWDSQHCVTAPLPPVPPPHSPAGRLAAAVHGAVCSLP